MRSVANVLAFCMFSVGQAPDFRILSAEFYKTLELVAVKARVKVTSVKSMYKPVGLD